VIKLSLHRSRELFTRGIGRIDTDTVFIYLIPWSTLHLEKLIVVQLVKKLEAFMETKDALPFSQEPSFRGPVQYFVNTGLLQ
jgi:hypothetical protein